MVKKVWFFILCASVAAANVSHAAVIISQYYEGPTGTNKFIELYNSGTSSVDLAAGAYKLSHWSNAARETWKTSGAPTATQALTGTIAPGDVYVIANTLSTIPSYVVPDQTNSGNGGVNYNGDDSVVLWTGTTYAFSSVVDAFGLTGNTAADISFVRAATILSGTNADFNSNDWVSYSIAQVANAASDSTEYIGYHVAIPEPASLALLGIGAIASLGVLRRKSA